MKCLASNALSSRAIASSPPATAEPASAMPFQRSTGSTLSTAPAFVLAQLCDFVDLDGPSSLADDPLAAQIYDGPTVMVPSAQSMVAR